MLVRFGTITKPVHFYIVSDRLKPILRVSDALNLGLTSFHCPVYNNWHDRQKIDLTPNVDSRNSSLCTNLYSTNATCTDTCPPNLTKESIVNHPKYAHLFRGIGRFKCNPVCIMTKQNVVPMTHPQIQDVLSQIIFLITQRYSHISSYTRCSYLHPQFKM